MAIWRATALWGGGIIVAGSLLAAGVGAFRDYSLVPLDKFRSDVEAVLGPADDGRPVEANFTSRWRRGGVFQVKVSFRGAMVWRKELVLPLGVSDLPLARDTVID